MATGVTVLLLYDFIFIQFTKTSIFCCLIGFYILLYEQKKWPAIALLLFGILLRAEAFWLILLFTAVIHLIYEPKKTRQATSASRITWLGIIAFGVFISFLNKKALNEDDRRYSAFRGFKYSIIDFRQDKIESADPKDAIKLKALRHAFFGDRDSLLNEKTLLHLGLHKHERFSFSNAAFPTAARISMSSENILSLYRGAQPYYFLWMAMVVAWLLLHYKRAAALCAGIAFITFMYIIAITLYIKMEMRVMNPLLVSALFYMMTLTDEKPGVAWKRNAFAAILVFAASAYFTGHISRMVMERRDLALQTQRFMRQWKKVNRETTLIPDLHSWQLFARPCADLSELKAMNMLSLDDGYMSMMNSHIEYMKAKTGGSHFSDYIRFIKEQREHMLFLGTPERVKLLKEYVMAVYNTSFEPVKVSNTPVITGTGATGKLEFYIFHL
jgi:hypothetical protein